MHAAIASEPVRGLASFDESTDLQPPPGMPRLDQFEGNVFEWLAARADWASTAEGREWDSERCKPLRDVEATSAAVEMEQRIGRATDFALRHTDTTRHEFGACFENFEASTEAQRIARLSVRGWTDGVITGEWRKGAPTRTLILAGPVGSGKSHLAIASVRRIVQKTGIRPVFWNAAELIRNLNPFAHKDSARGVERMINQAIAAPVLMVDDMGTRTAACTSNQLEGLFRIYNGRLRRDRWNLITTNVADILRMVGGSDDADPTDVKRIASRLGDGGHLLPVGGKWDAEIGDWARAYPDQRGQA